MSLVALEVKEYIIWRLELRGGGGRRSVGVFFKENSIKAKAKSPLVGCGSHRARKNPPDYRYFIQYIGITQHGYTQMNE